MLETCSFGPYSLRISHTSGWQTRTKPGAGVRLQTGASTFSLFPSGIPKILGDKVNSLHAVTSRGGSVGIGRRGFCAGLLRRPFGSPTAREQRETSTVIAAEGLGGPPGGWGAAGGPVLPAGLLQRVAWPQVSQRPCSKEIRGEGSKATTPQRQPGRLVAWVLSTEVAAQTQQPLQVESARVAPQSTEHFTFATKCSKFRADPDRKAAAPQCPHRVYRQTRLRGMLQNYVFSHHGSESCVWGRTTTEVMFCPRRDIASRWGSACCR